jgi:hypothetical protein
MSLLAPDLLKEALGLSPFLCGAGLVLGLFLWLFGRRAFRFWMVLSTTLLAGVGGLWLGAWLNMQPLVAGLLLAIAAGALALALFRLLIFFAVGMLGYALAQSLTPNLQESLACFVAGGLLGVLLFQFWVTVLTSFLGTLFMAYSSLLLVARFGRVDVVAFTEQHAPLLNWGCAACTVLGVLLQLVLQRRRGHKSGRQSGHKSTRAAVLGPPPPAAHAALTAVSNSWWPGRPEAEHAWLDRSTAPSP